jgi:hypothetical protein
MPRGEHQVISRGELRCAPIDAAAFTAKTLDHAAHYLVRHAFICEHRERGSAGARERGDAALLHLIKQHEADTALPRTVSTDSVRQLDTN